MTRRDGSAPARNFLIHGFAGGETSRDPCDPSRRTAVACGTTDWVHEIAAARRHLFVPGSPQGSNGLKRAPEFLL